MNDADQQWRTYIEALLRAEQYGVADRVRRAYRARLSRRDVEWALALIILAGVVTWYCLV